MRAASRCSALRKEILSAPSGRGEVLLEMLPGERLGPGKGVEDGAMGGSTVGNHRRPAHAEQRSASHLLVVDAPLHLLELGLHQQGSGGRHPAGLRSDRPWAIIAAPRTPSSGAPPTAS